MGKFGTKSTAKGKMDLFGKRDNSYKMFVQFASNEVNINLFPDLLIIKENFQQFFKEFAIIDQVQDFKPMKKPYDSKNMNFKEMKLKTLLNN